MLLFVSRPQVLSKDMDVIKKENSTGKMVGGVESTLSTLCFPCLKIQVEKVGFGLPSPVACSFIA